MMISFDLLGLFHYQLFQIISTPIFFNLKAKAESQLRVSDSYADLWKVGTYLFYWLLHFWNLIGVQNYSFHTVLTPKNDCGTKCFIRIIVFWSSFWVISSYLLPWLKGGPQWQPTPVLLPGKSHAWRSLVGCRLWGLTESDTTEVT